MKDFTKQNGGFTLIEAMIAVTILAIAVAGPLVTASRAYVAAEIARDQLTATYLAQEAIEYVRAMRDDEYLTAYHAGTGDISATAWNYFVNGGGSNPNASIASCTRIGIYGSLVCTLDPTLPMGTGSGSALQVCDTSSCGPLYLANNSTTNFYTQQSTLPGGKQTPFKRWIDIHPESSTSYTISAIVKWNFRGTEYTTQISEALTPWQ